MHPYMVLLHAQAFLLVGAGTSHWRFEVVQHQGLQDQPGSVYMTAHVRGPVECACVIAEQARWLGEYNEMEKYCTVFELSTLDSPRTPQVGSHILIRADPMATCATNPYGLLSGVGPWSDESMWTNYGRITAARKWISVAPNNHQYLSGLQFRFGLVEWGAVHGAGNGVLHEVYLAEDEYVTAVVVASGDIVDDIALSTNHVTGSLTRSDAVVSPQLGAQVAFLSGRTTHWGGEDRICQLIMHQTNCY